MGLNLSLPPQSHKGTHHGKVTWYIFYVVYVDDFLLALDTIVVNPICNCSEGHYHEDLDPTPVRPSYGDLLCWVASVIFYGKKVRLQIPGQRMGE